MNLSFQDRMRAVPTATARVATELVGLAMRTVVLACGLLLVIMGCSETQKPQNPILYQAQGAPPPVPAFSGFLGDYTKLQPGSGPDQAAHKYINLSVNWGQYNAVMIDPVQFWGGDTTNVPASEQEALCNYFYNELKDQLSRNFTVVDQPGPGVMRLSVAIVDATAATPVLRTASVVIPQARLLNKMKELATGTYAFVGGARGEAKLTDSQSGEILGEWVDQRVGGNAVQTAATWQWQDGQRVMDFWSKRLSEKLAEARAGSAPA